MLLTISFVVAMVTVATCNSMDVAPYKQLLLDEHSRYRSMQKGSDMNKLVRPYYAQTKNLFVL